MIKRIISFLLAFMVSASIFSNFAFAAGDAIVWSPSSTGGNAVVDEIDSIKGDAVAFRAWGTNSAMMSAPVSKTGDYAVSFSMLVTDFNAVRTVNVSGIDVLQISNLGKVSVDGSNIAEVKLNKWHDVQIVVYPELKRYKVSIDSFSKTVQLSSSVQDLTKIDVVYTDITENGAITLLSQPNVIQINELSNAVDDELTMFNYHSATGGGSTGRTWLTNNDPTGRNKAKIYKHTQISGTGGEFRVTPDPGLDSGLVEYTANIWVNPIAQGETTPDLVKHYAKIKRNNSWFKIYEIDHVNKTLTINDNVVDLEDYSYGQWLTLKIFADYPNEIYTVMLYDEEGNLLGTNYREISIGTWTAMNITLEFKDDAGGYVSYIEGFGGRTVVSSAAPVSCYPFRNEKNVASDSKVGFAFRGGVINPSSLTDAVITVDGQVNTDATIAIDGPQGIIADVGSLADGNHVVSITGLKDMAGNIISNVSTNFTTGTSIGQLGNISLSMSAGGFEASVPATTLLNNVNLYAVTYNSDGDMADYDVTPQVAGEVNDHIEASVSTAYTGVAKAYLWDDNMNIITPACTSFPEQIVASEPCALSISKDYDTDLITVKGTAKLGAAIMLMDGLNNILHIEEVPACANGYFETSFYSETTGDVNFLINTQDGSGIQTVPYKLYTTASFDEIIEDFDYSTVAPEYNADDPVQYAAMVDHYDALIREHYSLLEINLSEYNAVEKEKIADALYAGSYSQVPDIVSVCKTALMVASFEAAENANDIQTLMTRYVSDLSTASTYAYYTSQMPEHAKAHLYATMAQKSYDSKDSIVSTFEELSVLSVIEAAAYENEISAMISALNQNYLGIELASYNKLIDKNSVLTPMMGEIYDSVSLFKLDFEEKSSAALANQFANATQWSAIAESGTAVVENVSTIKGNAASFKAWGTTDAKMTASVAMSAQFNMSFNVLFSDFNAVRTLKIFGAEIFKVNKSGVVSADGSNIATVQRNQWYKVSVSVYPSIGKLDLKFDDGYTTMSLQSLSSVADVILECTDIDNVGTKAIISDLLLSDIDAASADQSITESAFTYFDYNTVTGGENVTRSWLNGADPTGRNKAKVYKHTQNAGEQGEFRVLTDSNASSGLVEFSANVYVDAPAQGETTPNVISHKSTPKRDNAWFTLYTVDHVSKTLTINGNVTNLSDYEYGQWLTIKLFLDYTNDRYTVVLYDENGRCLGSGYNDIQIGALTSMNITMTFKDGDGGYDAYIEGYGWRNVSGTTAVAGVYPAPGQSYIGNDECVNIVVKGGVIDPASLAASTIKLDGSVIDATVSLNGASGVKVDVGTLSDGPHTVSVSGLTDFSGNVLPEIQTNFTTSSVDLGFSNLGLDTSSTVKSSVPVTTAGVNFDLYAVAYNADGSMAGKNSVSKNSGVYNTTVEATATPSSYASASAYLWDDNMNIITPAISDTFDSVAYSEPCNITITREYNPDTLTIKGTADGAAAMILKDNTNSVIFVKEAQALANGYFETTFASTVTGNITLLINTQDGQGIKTITQTIYTESQTDSIVDDFNYLQNNPSYDAANQTQYNAMVAHYDSLIRGYYTVFGFDLNEYNSVSANDVADILIDGTYTEIADVQAKYNEAMAVALFNAADSANKVSALVNRYFAFGFDTVDTYAYYNSLDAAVKQKVFENLSLKNDYQDVSDILDEFEAQAVLSAVEMAVIDSEIDGIISANNTYLQMDLSVYNTLRNTSAVTSAVKGIKYPTIEAFKNDFAGKTNAAKANEQSGNTPAGGGGGGGATTPAVNVPKLPLDGQVVTDTLHQGVVFDDLNEVPWAQESIVYLSDRGIINGKEEKKFAPTDNITRAEFVKIVVLAFNKVGYDNIKTDFEDVVPGAWYEQYVSKAYARGIINGQSEKLFGVNNNITREEIVVMLYRVAKERNIDLRHIKSVLFYDDASISDWAREAVAVMSETEIVNGADNKFSPKNPATRAEAAKLVYSLMQREAE